ncbi:MAG: hypothetical protein JO023_24400 [Chloroflexi bacterium]|nr:hypothetical protein [Chloroflexota bacterium]
MDRYEERGRDGCILAVAGYRSAEAAHQETENLRKERLLIDTLLALAGYSSTTRAMAAVGNRRS